MKIKKNKTYKCASCKGVFTSSWSQEDAEKEWKTLWTKEERSTPQVIVCDDCFKQIMKSYRSYRNRN